MAAMLVGKVFSEDVRNPQVSMSAIITASRAAEQGLCWPCWL